MLGLATIDLPAKHRRPRRQRIPSPPSHLTIATQAWWKGVVRNYFLEPHHLRLLTLAGESWDRCQQAREQIVKDGILQADRFGVSHAHPAVAIERDSRLAFARLLRELDLDAEPGPAPSRPPAIERR